MYHIKIEDQPWNNKYVVRIMNGEETVIHREVLMPADEADLEAVGKELYEAQITEDNRNKEAEELKAKETKAIMDETLAKVADEIDCKGTLVKIKKSISSVMKVTAVEAEPIEAEIKEEKVK